jgi:hypothetical protein
MPAPFQVVLEPHRRDRWARRLAHLLRTAMLVPLACALVACGSSDDDDTPPDDGGDGGAIVGRGDLLQDPPVLVRTITPDDILANLDDPLYQALLLQAGTPLCDVQVHKIEYATVGGAGEDTTASGALMVPSGADERCQGARPIVLYAHGTSTDRTFDIADLDDDENAEGIYLAVFFATQGYIVAAPNYAGYDTSTLGYHPYLVAEQQANEMIDALTAARSALPLATAPDTSDAGKLFVTGYSQGGYVAMATQRAMEAAGMPVTATAPLSGPYALSAFLDAVFFGRVSGGATVQGTFLFTAYQRAFGSVYSNPGDLFSPQYAGTIEGLLPSQQTRSELYEQGLLPRDAFFSLEPPAAQYAAITPATEPAPFAPLYARGFAATDFLVRNEYRLAYLQDAEAAPDGFWPTTTSAEPPAAPALPLRQALKANDLRNWTPTTPTLLCGGHDDPVVFWLNTQAMEAYWATHAPGAPYTVLDVDAAPTGDADPYGELKQRFGAAKDLVAMSGGGFEAVLEAYHTTLVAPFCLEAARDFFEGR